jgi:NAD(P)-dependent dehydrogenase (short-subunit alcohol dehydrogenase family)
VSALHGKAAIVTGAGRGIGRGIAVEFAREGARVAAADRDDAALAVLADDARGLGLDVLPVVCDVGVRAQIDALVDRTVHEFGTVDVLVNAAQGVPPTGDPVEAYPEEKWDFIFQTGVKGVLYAMQAVFPHMKDRGGRIINFGSMVGQIGRETQSAYAANKEAIRGLSRNAALEWGKYGITVNVINPRVPNDKWRPRYEADAEMMAKLIADTPLGRMGEPEDVARVAVFIASDDSRFMTGQTFMVDGGCVLFS